MTILDSKLADSSQLTARDSCAIVSAPCDQTRFDQWARVVGMALKTNLLETSLVRQITGVDENVASGKLDLAVVCIRYTDNPSLASSERHGRILQYKLNNALSDGDVA